MNIWCGVPSGDSQGHSTWWPLQTWFQLVNWSVYLSFLKIATRQLCQQTHHVFRPAAHGCTNANAKDVKMITALGWH